MRIRSADPTCRSRRHIPNPIARTHGLDLDAIGRYVFSCRTTEGGYCFYRTPEWNVEEPNAPDTLAALETLRLLGIDIPDPDGTRRWLSGLQDENAGYPSLTIGWAVLRSCSLLQGPPHSSPLPWLRAWQARIFDDAHLRGHRSEFREMLHFVELVQLVGLGLRAEGLTALSVLLGRGRDPIGGWATPSADLETTATALRLVELAGLAHVQQGKTERFVRDCEDVELGFRLTPSGRATSVGALWGGLTVWQLLGQKPKYPRSISLNLALLQNRTGGLGVRHHAISTLQHTWLGLEASCLLHDLTEVQP